MPRDSDTPRPTRAPSTRRRTGTAAKRAAILKAAAGILCSKGLAEFTLAEVAATAGTFAGSLYYHFASKEHLIEEVLNIGTTGVSDMVAAAVASLPADASARERIAVAFRCHLSQMLMKDNFIVAYWRIIDQVSPELRARHLAKPRAYGRFWRELLEHAVATGEIRPDANTSLLRLILIGSSIWALDWFHPEGRLTPAELADSILDMLLAGVGGRARP